MATIGILHMGLYGHLWPARRLGDVLARRGHRVIAWADPRFRGEVEGGTAEYREAARPEAGALAAVGAAPPRSAAHRPGHVPNDFSAIAASRAAIAAATAREVIEALAAAEVELLVHDCMVAEGRVAGEWLGLPRVCSYPLFPPFRLPALEPSTAGVEHTMQAARYAVASEWGVDLGDLGSAITNFGDRTFVYTTAEVSGMEPPDRSWRMIGPLLGPAPDCAADATLPPDKGRPWIYVAFGTLFSGRPELFRAVLEALADDEVDVLAGTGGRLDPRELDPVPDNATVMLMAPARAALRRAAVCVTHGGISSVHEALEAGVPMVVLPQGSDQTAWGRRVGALGAGEVLAPDAAPAAIREAVLRQLTAAEPRAHAERLGEHLRAYDGEGMAAEAVELLLR